MRKGTLILGALSTMLVLWLVISPRPRPVEAGTSPPEPEASSESSTLTGRVYLPDKIAFTMTPDGTGILATGTVAVSDDLTSGKVVRITAEPSMTLRCGREVMDVTVDFDVTLGAGEDATVTVFVPKKSLSRMGDYVGELFFLVEVKSVAAPPKRKSVSAVTGSAIKVSVPESEPSSENETPERDSDVYPVTGSAIRYTPPSQDTEGQSGTCCPVTGSAIRTYQPPVTPVYSQGAITGSAVSGSVIRSYQPPTEDDSLPDAVTGSAIDSVQTNAPTNAKKSINNTKDNGLPPTTAVASANAPTGDDYPASLSDAAPSLDSGDEPQMREDTVPENAPRRTPFSASEGSHPPEW